MVQELVDLFRVSNQDEKFLWRFLLGTGFRQRLGRTPPSPGVKTLTRFDAIKINRIVRRSTFEINVTGNYIRRPKRHRPGRF